MMAEHVFGVKHARSLRTTVVTRAGFDSADSRTASVSAPSPAASRTVVSRFAATSPTAQILPAGRRAESARPAVSTL